MKKPATVGACATTTARKRAFALRLGPHLRGARSPRKSRLHVKSQI